MNRTQGSRVDAEVISSLVEKVEMEDERTFVHADEYFRIGAKSNNRDVLSVLKGKSRRLVAMSSIPNFRRGL